MTSRYFFSTICTGLTAIYACFIAGSIAYAQASFDFTGPPVLLSGSDLQQGAVYRYSSVATGIDALVEINELSNATVVQLDDSNGVSRALQPEIDGDAVGSYVEFNIYFVDGGTSNASPVSGTFSALDIDSTLEFDTFFNVSDYTAEANSDLTFAVSAPQTLNVTGGGPGYAPTSEANTPVVVSVSVNALPGFTYRAGVNGNVTRQTSLLFEPVAFNSPVYTNINDAPIAVDDTNSLSQNSTLSVDVSSGLLANDTDLDISSDGDTLKVDSITIGVNTYITNNSVSLLEGELIVNSDGSYQFIPAANFSGSVPVVSYQISDVAGASDTSTLSLTVLPANSAPVLSSDSAILSSYDPLFIQVLDNDEDDGRLNVNSLVWVADLSGYPDGSSLSSDLKILTIAGEGTWTIVSGEAQFMAISSASGVITPVNYSVADDEGLSETAQVSLQDGLASDAAVVTIDEDINDDGYIDSSEISGLINVSAQLPAQTVVGDTISFADTSETKDVVLDANDLLAGSVSVAFNLPVDGGSVQVRSSLIDAAGNQSVVSRDQATMDVSATDAPVVTISTDLDNSGFISAQENSDTIEIAVGLPATAGVNDTVTITSGATATEIVLTPIDIANGSVSTTISAPADGEALSVVAQITDEAGNQSSSGSDSAMIDTTAPDAPEVNSLVSSSNRPSITGTAPVDGNYLLSVQVNGVVYASGDGQLTASPSGDWSLDIPASDALVDGVYDVNAVVTDMAGNLSVDVTDSELVVDLQAPELAANNIGPSSDNSPLLSGSSDQPDGTAVMVKTDDGTRVCEASVSAGQWTCAAQIPLAIGLNPLEATIVDLAGNSTTDSFSVTVAAATDTDGDSIPDDLETTDDFDGDGIPNYLDLDSDNDTIPDATEGQIDRDSDGVRNYLDLDSDNDGLSDLGESRLRLDDSDTRGQVGDDVPVGANGWADYAESAPDSGLGEPPVDSDGDSLPDYLDHDSDGDGISDVVENGHVDTDADAMRSDNLLAAALDFDQDGVPNYRDLDSDQDGITDIRELPADDINGDGMVDDFSDSDRNGLADSISGASAGVGHGSAQDLDADGSANFLDLDSDGDRKSDLIETGGVDVNNDGIHDAYLDENGNAVPDAIDAQLTLGDDVDGDLIDDRFDADFVLTGDADMDGVVDDFDIDANGNGYVDLLNDSVLQFPDLNGDGQEDVYDAVTPVTGALLRTGVGSLGGGCSIQSPNLSSTPKPKDFLFFVLLLGALAGLSRRKVLPAK